MPGFTRDNDTLVCDGQSLEDIAREAGTPCYVYSAPAIRARYQELDAAFAGHPHAIHYALKANSTLAVVRLLRGLGAHADANSGGEIDVALRAGFAPGEIVFTGVGKSPAEIERAVGMGLKAINAESFGEMDRIDLIARRLGTRARVAVRINPDIDALSHPGISTGRRSNKFGVAVEDARAMCREMATRAGLQLVGLHVHVGSQVTRLEPLTRAAEALVKLAAELEADGVSVEHLDVGGGLGISYDGGSVPTVADYAAAVLPIVAASGRALVLEPGRVIVGPAGVLLTRVVDMKPQAGLKMFVIADAGMTELMRPMLYGAYHAIEAVTPRAGAAIAADVVGPVCETTDTLGADRALPPIEVGDLLAVRDAGAYGSVMGSNYNRRPFPPEVLVDEDGWRIVRRRQTIDDLLRTEAE
ncbi:MAG TPA: diaminopimelate decarboxylase [Vicinamibacterales bacterium]|nr:diaminopimelate decarboxylase [Vicinamibacterales bacterium]